MNELEQLLDTIQNLKNAKATISEAYDSKIGALSAQLEVMLKGAKLPKLSTDLASAYWQNNTSAEIKDWDAVMRYVKENDAFDILQKRISPAQLKSRLEAGAKINGASVKTESVFIIRGKKE